MLIDATNFDAVAPEIINEMRTADFIGLDGETEDSLRHDGLNTYCGYNEEGKKSPGKPLVFDMRRTTMCGFSLYTETSKEPYYINLNHADAENRVQWEKALKLIEAKPIGSHFLAHNAPFEMAVFRSCYDLDLTGIICTLQMCVSAYGPHEYPHDEWLYHGRGGIGKLVPALHRLSDGFDPNNMSPELSELVYKIIAKESNAEHSWNGFVDSISYGYGLKDAVKSHFNHQMTTYEECLRGRAHMGQLTGAEVADYGGEDAYWVLPLFRHLMSYMAQECPDALDTFIAQENPMVPVYAQIWTDGMKVNTQAILNRRDLEREETAQVLRRMKETIRTLLPFPSYPNEDLMQYDGKGWYEKNWQKYRAQVEAFANLPNETGTYNQCQQVRSAVSNAWAKETGNEESKGINITHYMPMRTILYDLIGAKHVKAEGKTQSDGEARGRIKDQLKRDGGRGVDIVDDINSLAGIEQRMKLYLTPYSQLMDPETHRLYPVVSSKLATRRMACSFPNAQQLAKRGESRYVRGFFLADA